MSDEEKLEKPYNPSPEKTLITLEQLSQTIEVMTSVVNRLRQHLSQQLEQQLETQNALKTEIKSSPSDLETRPKAFDEMEKNAFPEVRHKHKISTSSKKEKKIIH